MPAVGDEVAARCSSPRFRRGVLFPVGPDRPAARASCARSGGAALARRRAHLRARARPGSRRARRTARGRMRAPRSSSPRTPSMTRLARLAAAAEQLRQRRRRPSHRARPGAARRDRLDRRRGRLSTAACLRPLLLTLPRDGARRPDPARDRSAPAGCVDRCSHAPRRRCDSARPSRACVSRRRAPRRAPALQRAPGAEIIERLGDQSCLFFGRFWQRGSDSAPANSGSMASGPSSLGGQVACLCSPLGAERRLVVAGRSRTCSRADVVRPSLHDVWRCGLTALHPSSRRSKVGRSSVAG